MKRVLILLSVFGLLVGACGGGDDKEASTVDGDTTTTAASGSDDGGDLNAKLLTVADLPTGYSPDPSADDSEDEEDDESQFCKDLQDFETKHKADEDVEASFQKGEPSFAGAGFLKQGLGRYKSADEADEAIDGFSSAMKSCKEFEQTEDDGSTFKGTFSPLSFTKLGDDTFAAHMKASGTTEGTTIDLGGDFVAIRKGRIVVMLFSFGFGASQIPTSELETIAKTALAKV